MENHRPCPLPLLSLSLLHFTLRSPLVSIGRRRMIGISSLLLWASLSIGVAAGGCYTELEITLNAEPSNEGWNGVGRGFLSMFTPAKLTDEHWQMVGKIYREKNYGLIKDFAMKMGGLVFLVVVAVLLILCFCAAPIGLCVFSCTCKKKCKLGSKSKSNIIAYSGIGCNSLAMFTISLSILFCYLSLNSLTDGIKYIGDSVKPLPETIEGAATMFKNQLMDCGVTNLKSGIKGSTGNFPETIADKVAKLLEPIDFEKKKADIAGFATTSGELVTELTTAENDAALQSPAVVEVKNALGKTREKMVDVKKLDDVGAKQKKGSKSEIKKKIEEETKASSEKIDKVEGDINKQIEDGFTNIKTVKKKVSSFTEKIISYVDKSKDYLGYMQAINLLLFPCYLALASAIWSTCKATKLVKKKKAKRREKTALLVPLAIGISLAFIPLLTSTAFMMAAGVTNVACGTVFKDDSFGFIPTALKTLDQNATFTIKDEPLDIATVLQECKARKNLITVFKAENRLDVELVSKLFDLKAKKQEMAETLNGMSFGLPQAGDWTSIEGEITKIKEKRKAAVDQLGELKELPWPESMGGGKAWENIAPVKEIVIKMETFTESVGTFLKNCESDITTAKNLDEAILKKDMVKIMNGDDTTNTRGLMDEMLSKINEVYLSFRSELIKDSPDCHFIIPLFESFGRVFCDQALGGLNGVYAAIGLAVMSFFSATAGTVLIWHSFRAGRGQQEDEKTGGSGSKKNKKKGEKGEKKKEGEEEESPPDMAGKVGEQATPIGPTDPVPPGGQPNGVVQAVPTDPDKTNPSLLPNDALPADPNAAAASGGVQPESGGSTAGTPISPNPIQMVHMETNPNPNPNPEEPKSSTGAGNGETAGATNAQ